MTRKFLSNVLAITGLIMALVISFGGPLVYGQSITLSIQGLRSSEGYVHVLVYDNVKAFDETSHTDFVTYRTKSASAGELSMNLNGIRPGTYALMIHHDENGNNKFDSDGQTPLEGWAYSNNVGQTQTPDFVSASFAFGDTNQQQNININYAN
ncbi:MAG: DUF2141 domain-containing protein [Rhizobiaceae bacterium]